MNRIQRCLGIVAALGGTLLALAAAAPAALAILPPPDPTPAAVLGPNRAGYPPISHVRTVVVGGMPGWQIALIAVGAALAAAVTAVILYRLWTARYLAHPAT
jgi:hypothetical protein